MSLSKEIMKNLQFHIFGYNQAEDYKVFVLKVHYSAFTQDADRVWVESDITFRVRREFFPHYFKNLPLIDISITKGGLKSEGTGRFSYCPKKCQKLKTYS